MDIRFFVTGHGRSGTKWVARLLNIDPSVHVHHEPINEDATVYHKIRASTYDVHAYLHRRATKMCRIWERNPSSSYAEVNSYLRYFTTPLIAAFPAPIAAIIRDGRYVVRSMLNRGIYSKPNYPPIASPSVYYTPFEKCCWYWADTYRNWINDIPTFTLEQLNLDFAYFSALCRHLHVNVSEQTWQKYTNRPVNVGVGNKSLNWSSAETTTFMHIAGDIYEDFYVL